MAGLTLAVKVTMDEQTMTVLSERAEDLRYVTEHFQDLQGIGLAPLWAFLFASVLFGFTPSSGRAVLITLITAVPVIVLSRLWERKWYNHRYGVVIKPASPQSTSPWQQRLMALILALGVGAIWFRLFDKNNDVMFAVVLGIPVLLPRCFDTAVSSGTLLRRMLYSASLMAMVVLSAWCLFGGLSGRWLLASLAGGYLLLSTYDHYLLHHILRPGTRTRGERR